LIKVQNSLKTGTIYEKKAKILKRLNKYENSPRMVFGQSTRNASIQADEPDATLLLYKGLLKIAKCSDYKTDFDTKTVILIHFQFFS
jgi:hypothetical protein